MKKNIFSILIFLFFSISNVAIASVSNGTIGHIIVGGGGLVYITTANGITNLPACNTTNRYVININTAQGKALYTLFTVAFATNQNVYIAGKGLCDIDSTAESIEAAASPYG